MAGYLDQYGAGEERRNRIIIRSILATLLIAFVGTLSWYLLLNHHQEGIVKDFVAALKRGDTQAAYAIWGCTSAKPCPDYKYEQFMKDWGPGADGPDLAVLGLTDSEECNNARDGQRPGESCKRTRTTLAGTERSKRRQWASRPTRCARRRFRTKSWLHRTVGKLRKILLQ